MTHALLKEIPYLDISFWQSICPHLTITEGSPIRPPLDPKDLRIRESDWLLCKQLIREDGYFAYESYFETELTDRLAEGLRTMDKKGIPPVFSFLYDEYWQVLQLLDPLLSDLLGAYKLLPAVWSWLVKSTEQTGFSPHRDVTRETSIENPNHLDYLTVWIPLTDLNHLSSSIFVLPASLDPRYDQNTQRTDVDNLQDIRSLQAPKGSVLAWAVGLAHWGSTQSKHGDPRMSIGYYVQKAEADCVDGPPIDLEVPFPLRQRLSIVGDQILSYSRDRDMDLINFAKSLVDLNEG